jgi:uncharacterized membrane protein YuzA (DUF378 family)
MENDQYSAPVSRVASVVVGMVVTAIGVALLGFFGLGLYRLTSGLPSSEVMVVLCIVGILGIGLCVVGLRLLTGKRRRDGGLFSPWFLRLGGVIFLLAPVAAILSRSWFGLLKTAVLLPAAIACFVLANRRKGAVADQGAPNNRWRGP